MTHRSKRYLTVGKQKGTAGEVSAAIKDEIEVTIFLSLSNIKESKTSFIELNSNQCKTKTNPDIQVGQVPIIKVEEIKVMSYNGQDNEMR